MKPILAAYDERGFVVYLRAAHVSAMAPLEPGDHRFYLVTLMNGRTYQLRSPSTMPLHTLWENAL